MTLLSTAPSGLCHEAPMLHSLLENMKGTIMRIAIMIISLSLFVFILLQSCAAGIGGALQASEGLKGAAAIGVALAFIYVLGGAFALGAPLISMIMFAIGAIVATTVGATSEFKDLTVWGSLSAILCILCIFGDREKRAANRRRDGALDANHTNRNQAPLPKSN